MKLKPIIRILTGFVAAVMLAAPVHPLLAKEAPAPLYASTLYRDDDSAGDGSDPPPAGWPVFGMYFSTVYDGAWHDPQLFLATFFSLPFPAWGEWQVMQERHPPLKCCDWMNPWYCW